MTALARRGLKAARTSVRQALKPAAPKKRSAAVKPRQSAAAPAKSAKPAHAAKSAKSVKSAKSAKSAKPANSTHRAAFAPKSGWTTGAALGATGALRYALFCPPGLKAGAGDLLPLLVMLHGCGQDAKGFAQSTRMNAVATREGFMVLYPEQDRLANPQGCWNWFDTRNGRALKEAALILRAVDQVCLLHAADRDRVAIAGLSAGASMAALVVTRHPGRFKAVAMHSGIAPGTAHSALSALSAMQGRRSARPLAKALSIDRTSTGIEWPPLLVIHGSADRVVSARNGQAAAQQWASAAGAQSGPPRQVQRGQRYPMTVADYKSNGRLVVTRVEVAGLGHAWSGGASRLPYGDSRGPDASRLVWAFVNKLFVLARTANQAGDVHRQPPPAAALRGGRGPTDG